MDVVVPAAFALGLLSGFKHAFEPDHVVAVSTLLHEEPKLPKAVRLGLAWGAGHTTTLVVGVLLVGGLRVQVTEAHLGYFELPVAVMLLALGGWALWGAVARVLALRRHRHDGVPHYHPATAGQAVGEHPHPHRFPWKRSGWQGYAVGMVHGLAGTGALLLLVAATLPTLAASVGYAFLFGAGSVLGMAAVTVGLALPFLASRSRPALYETLTGLSGALSIVLGVSLLYAAW